MKKKTLYLAPAVIGVLFCFYYLRLAADNVAYSDYVRLIVSYLPDVENPAKFFVPDILTRVPITYLGRLINVKLFAYNTMFDMALGVLSLGLGAAVLAWYSAGEKRVSYPWFLSAVFVYFSLNKWEMLTNGTGWVCFLSISGFYVHYLALDEAVKTAHKDKKNRITLLVLPSFLTLFVAGPYCASYSVILTLVYLVMMAYDYRKKKKWNRLYLGYLAAVLIPLILYLWSNSYAVYVHRGAVEGSLIEEFLSNPVFFLRFLLKALASAVVGVAQIEALSKPGQLLSHGASVYLLGAAAAAAYFFALFLNWRHKLYEKSIFPLLLILNGGLNHLLILVSRWIFLKDAYGMSSRYELQYQMGIIGILLTFAMTAHILRERVKEREDGEADKKACGKLVRQRYCAGILICLGTGLILLGNIYTTWEELKTAPYRKEYLQLSRSLGLQYRTASDEDLVAYLHNDADKVRQAMRILEENRLNIFSDNAAESPDEQ